MSAILQDASPSKLVTAIEENLFAWIPLFGKLGRAFTTEPVHLKRATTAIPSPLFNSVMDAQLPPDLVDETIQLILLDAKARNVPVRWWTSPTTRPVDLDKHLEKYGFGDRDEQHGMAVELAHLDESLPAPADLSIQSVQEDAARRQFASTMALGFGALSTPREVLLNGWCILLSQVDSDTGLAYTGWLNGKPVATSLVFMAAGVAGMFCVSTIPAARRQGIGAQMTLHALRQARDRGYKIGVVIASEMGYPVYRSLGCQEYCQITSYDWRPE